MAETKKPKITLEDTPVARPDDAPKFAASNSVDEKNVSSAPEPAASASGRLRSWASNAFPGHACAFLGGAAGLVVAVLVFVIGLFRTLFVLFCVLVGVAVGQFFDGNPFMVRVVGKLFGDNQ